MVANLSTWLLANPGAKGAEQPRNPDYEPDGTWYSMTFDQGRLYVVEPNHGLLVTVHPTTGQVTLVNDLFATFGDHTYTTLAVDRGDLYVGTLGRIVFAPGGPDLAASFDAGVYRLSRNGEAVQIADGLHAILGLAFDERHRLYVLQSPIFVPGTGSLIRIDADGSVVPIVSGLTFPSALTRGPDGAMYVSVCGYHCLPGQGEILRVAAQN
jgi:sugar lactone lactonase YvrE